MKKDLMSGLAGLLLAATPYQESYAVESKKEESTRETQLIRHEGYRIKTYLDTEGIPTIGVGFNLTRPDASNLVQRVGADYTQVLKGKQTLTENQVMQLFRYDLSNTVIQARQIVKSYDKQPKEVQDIVVNMIYNLGPTGFSKFKKAIAAIEARNYTDAAQEMKDSNWYHQIGNRSKELVRQMQNVSASKPISYR